jgi:hypothetical protein
MFETDVLAGSRLICARCIEQEVPRVTRNKNNNILDAPL